MSEENTPAVESTEDQIGNRIAWFCAGAVIGLGAAILLAPKSGRETREFLTKKTQEGREAVTSTADSIIESSQELFHKGRQLVDDATDLFERGRKLVRG